jgi:AcrR family transcriptional regulator
MLPPFDLRVSARTVAEAGTAGNPILAKKEWHFSTRTRRAVAIGDGAANPVLVYAMASVDERKDGEASWRQRAVSKSLRAAQTRAEQRVQRLLDAAFSLIDERGSSDFTIQEVVDRSKQSLRGFYQYFDGKDELLFALLEETIREAHEDLRAAVKQDGDPLARLRAFTIRLHEWCDPLGQRRKRGSHNRVPISTFSLQLALDDAQRVAAAMAPISKTLIELVEAAAKAGSLKVGEPRRAALLIQQTVMYGWLMNSLVKDPRARVTAEDAWKFCLHGLGA